MTNQLTLEHARELLRGGKRAELEAHDKDALFALLGEVRRTLAADRLAAERAGTQDLAGATDADLNAHAKATALMTARIQRGVFEEIAFKGAYERARQREYADEARAFAQSVETELPRILEECERAAADYRSSHGELTGFVQQMMDPIVWDYLDGDPLADRALSDRLTAALGSGELSDRVQGRQIHAAQWPTIAKRGSDWVALRLDKVTTGKQLAAWQAAVPGVLEQVPGGSTAAKQIAQLRRDLSPKGNQ